MNVVRQLAVNADRLQLVQNRVSRTFEHSGGEGFRLQVTGYRAGTSKGSRGCGSSGRTNGFSDRL
jgi:hypothetical protein